MFKLKNRILTLSCLVLASCGMTDAQVTEVKSQEALESLIAATDTKPLILKVYMIGCGPCEIYKPTFEKAAKELGNKATFASANYKNIDIDEYGVQSFPATLLFSNGKVVKKLRGSQKIEDIRTALNNCRP